MTTVKRHLQIKGYGTALPAYTVTFKDQTRYRVKEGEEKHRLILRRVRLKWL